MKDKETIFKKAIERELEKQLIEIGYLKAEEHKGFVRYKSSNNYLKLVFEWNRAQSFYCEVGFESNGNWDYEYLISDIIYKLNKNVKIKDSTYGKHFSDRIEEWVFQISNEIDKYKIFDLTKNDPIIEELRREYTKRDEVYNKELQAYQTKIDADQAWNSKDFKLFIKIMKEKSTELPKSYDKKFQIAEKRTS